MYYWGYREEYYSSYKYYLHLSNSKRTDNYSLYVEGDTGWAGTYKFQSNLEIITDNVSIVLPENCSKLFMGFTTKDYPENLDFSNVKDASYMFANSGVVSLSGRRWRMPKVETVSNMFGNCLKLTDLDCRDWGLGNCTNFSSMFYYCQRLTGLYLSGWDTSKATNMSSMFHRCDVLTYIDGLGAFNTANVQNMSYMFAGCYKLYLGDIQNWNVSKVNNFDSMFDSYQGEELNLRGWVLSRNFAINFSGMFNRCPNLRHIYVNSDTDWRNCQSSGSTGMFGNAPNLPNYNSNEITLSKAYPSRNGGYLDFPDIVWITGRWFIKTESGWKESELRMHNTNWDNVTVYMKSV